MKTEISQHAKYTCPFCGKTQMKRWAVGTWHCGSCVKTVAGRAWTSKTTSALRKVCHQEPERTEKPVAATSETDLAYNKWVTLHKNLIPSPRMLSVLVNKYRAKPSVRDTLTRQPSGRHTFRLIWQTDGRWHRHHEIENSNLVCSWLNDTKKCFISFLNGRPTHCWWLRVY